MNSHLSNEELLVRIEALEAKVRQSRLMMKRPGHDEYERLVDVVCDHEERLSKEEEELQKCTESVSELEDANW
jgi:hypothetical protein|tara:strand:+ start:461 stop:679 length:219 start_codon:yes stop_codon:yes gene_type:complete